MTIPSGTVYLSNVKTEFGPFASSVPNNLGAYLKASPGTTVGPSPFTGPISSAFPLSLKSFNSAANNNTGTPTFNNTYSRGLTSQTQPVQPGTRVFVVESWGAGGGGSAAKTICGSGFGGGGGGYARSVISLPSPNSSSWGATVLFNVGTGGGGGSFPAGSGNPGGASNVSSGTFTLPTISTAGGGSGGTGGTGGPASGGSANNTVGFSRPGAPGSSFGAPAITGSYSTPTLPVRSAGAGGCCTVSGANGAVRFVWL